MKKFYYLLCALCFPSLTQALQLDTMLLVSDKQGNGVFSLTNELPKTSLINGKIVEIDVVDGQLKETPYTKENLQDWKITLTNPNLILEQNRTKQVGVRSLCDGDCNFLSDKVYQIYFSPIPYDKGAGNKVPTLGINYGYAPIYIIPAKKSHVRYNLENKGDALYVNNKGNTFIRIQIDACGKAKGNVETGCRTTFTALAGREITFKLNEKFRSSSLKIRIANFDNSYFKEFFAENSKVEME